MSSNNPEYRTILSGELPNIRARGGLVDPCDTPTTLSVIQDGSPTVVTLPHCDKRNPDMSCGLGPTFIINGEVICPQRPPLQSWGNPRLREVTIPVKKI